MRWSLYALGLMAKPMLVTLPFTLLLLDFWPLRRLALPLRWRSGALKELLWEKAPLFAMSAASCVVTAIVQRSGGAVKTMEEFPFAERCANAALAYVSYLGKTFWPSSLAVFYPHPHIGLFTWAACGSALLLAGATVLAFRLAKRAPYLAFGWFWYLGTLVPVIGLVQVGEQAMADRYTYVPLIGVFIAIAWGLAELAQKIPRARLVAPGIAAASLVVLFPITRVQTGTWVGSEALFEHALAVTSNNLSGPLPTSASLCSIKARRMKPSPIIRKRVRIDPDFCRCPNQSWHRPGQAKARIDEAIEHYQQALRINPATPKALNNLGLVLLRR